MLRYLCNYTFQPQKVLACTGGLHPYTVITRNIIIIYYYNNVWYPGVFLKVFFL